MIANLALRVVLSLPLLACSPARGDLDAEAAPLPGAGAQVPARPGPAAPDLGYACGTYSGYRARTDGVVRSPCDYDVARLLSLGGEVRARIRPPAITLEFPDGTTFSGETDGATFTAVRMQSFPFQDGCLWRATETLQGAIDVADECRLHAAYRYREAPQSPPPCAAACTIDAQVVIDRVSIRVE